jgi:Spy/CpxP family protein refolding chaperone
MAISDKRWKASLMVLLVFVIGFATGALTANLMPVASEKPPSREERRPRGPEGYMQHLAKELGLTPEQGEAIRQIVAETSKEYGRLRQELDPRFQDIRSRSRDRIRAVLSPEQRSKYEELVRRHDEKRFKNKN